MCYFATILKKVPGKQKGFVKKGGSFNLPKVFFKYARGFYFKTSLEGSIEA